MEKLKQFINDLRNEKNGFTFDQPWRLEEKSMNVLVPILRKSKKRRKYITFSEAEDIKVKDTGQIDYVYITNNESKPVLICRGDIFRGKTQERVAIHDYIIQPTKSLRVSVRCIHQSKGINGNAEMKYSGRVSSDVDLSSQGHTWNTISETITTYYSNTNINDAVEDNTLTQANPVLGRYARMDPIAQMFGSNVKNDNYVEMLDDIVDDMKTVMKKMPFIKNQVGVVFFEDNDLKGLEIYDSKDSWNALKEDVIQKEGSSFISKDDENLFEFKPSAAKKLIKKRLNVEFVEKDIYNKEYKLVNVKSDDYVGEGLIWKNDVIHFSLWKRHR